MSESLTSLLTNRKVSIELKRENSHSKSIELAPSQTQTASDIPEAVDGLIDNKMYRNKFRKLIREGHLSDLLELAAIAQDKDKPSHWFAVATGKKHWQATLKFLSALRSVRQTAEEVLRRVQVPTGSMKAVYKACWRLKDAAVRQAVTAQETGRDPFRYFCWLTSPKRLGTQP
jgi:hypothetical protein